METPTRPKKKNQSFSKEPMITQEFKEEERNEVWGSIFFFEELKEKNVEKGNEKKKAKSRKCNRKGSF